jgi:BASS family bile acid:Na+ symporter
MFGKILSFYTRYFAVWVIIFGVLAYFCPGPFVALKDFNNHFFALTMFGIGAVLQLEDFKQIARNPVIVIIGTCAEFIIMPFGAFAIAKILSLPPEITAGLILTGSAPAAMSSNVMNYIAKADVAYSVSMTTTVTLLCPLLTPGLTFMLARSQLPVPFLDMVLSVIYMVILPLFAGFGVRHFFKEKLEKVLPIFPAISVTFIIFICSLVIALNRDYLPMVTGMLLAGVVILNLYGMLAGYFVAVVFRMNKSRRRTLSIEIGMQNAGLGATLAVTHLGVKAAMPAALFVFVCIITASVAAQVWQKHPPEISPANNIY